MGLDFLGGKGETALDNRHESNNVMARSGAQYDIASATFGQDPRGSSI